jgi:hypothetical protein
VVLLVDRCEFQCCELGGPIPLARVQARGASGHASMI